MGWRAEWLGYLSDALEYDVVSRFLNDIQSAEHIQSIVDSSLNILEIQFLKKFAIEYEWLWS